MTTTKEYELTGKIQSMGLSGWTVEAWEGGYVLCSPRTCAAEIGHAVTEEEVLEQAEQWAKSYCRGE